MITQVMEYCNKHFPRTMESPDITFKNTAGVYTIEASFSEAYLVGQYVYIHGSLLNDGAYKITAVESGVLTVDTVLYSELPSSTDVTVRIFGLAVPRGFLDVVSDINTWKAANGGKEGVASEKIDDYSISYMNSGSGSGNTWQSAFSARLRPYKSLYNDFDRYIRYGY